MTGSSGAIGLSPDAIATCSGVQIADAEVSRIPRFGLLQKAQQPRLKRAGLSYRVTATLKIDVLGCEVVDWVFLMLISARSAHIIHIAHITAPQWVNRGVIQR